MAATLTNQVSSLLQANSDEAIEVVAEARDIGHPIPDPLNS